MKLIEARLDMSDMLINLNQIVSCKRKYYNATEVSMCDGKTYLVVNPEHDEFIRMLKEDA